MAKEVRFKPVSVAVNLMGFILGFFFSNLLIPIINAVVSFLSGGGEFPTQSLAGPVSNMSGPLALIIIGVIGIMIMLLIGKIKGLILWVLIGLLLQAILVAAGVQIPSFLDLIQGAFGG